MATTYDQQQQGSANKDLAQKNEAQVPAGQGTEVVNAAHGNIANTFAKAESEKTNSQGQSNDPYSTFNYYWKSYTVPKTGKTQTLSGSKLGGSYFGKVNGQFIKDMTIAQLQELSPDTCTKNFTISYTDGDPDKQVTGRLFALGRYQIIPDTLQDLFNRSYTLKKNKITKDMKFSEQVQDLFYSAFIKDNGFRSSIGQYLEDKNVNDSLLEKAALELAQHWASIGIKPKTTNKYGQKGAENGLTSYYSGDGLNNAHISYNQIVAALKADREAVQSGRMAIQTDLIEQKAKQTTGAADNTAKADTASDKAAATPTSPQKQDEKQASAPAPTTAINIDVQAAITFNKRVNAGRVEAIQTLVETKADGDIGPNTVNKIAEWQQKHNLTPDGKFGSGSLEYAIKNCGFKDPLATSTTPTPNNEDKGEKPADDPKPAENNNTPTVANGLPKVDYTGTDTITKGAKGKAVEALQTYLNHYGFNVGTVDGSFGNGTLTQLMYYQYTRNLQSNGGICVDGNCGPGTWKALRSNASQVYGLDEPVAFSKGQKLSDVPSQRLDAGGVMTPSAAAKFNQMQAASGGLLKETTSTYRAMTGAGTRKATGGAGNSGQIELYVEWNRNPTYCARPGYSNHQSGKAADIAGCGPRDAGNTKLYKWLVNNCKTYGFQRYSKESWHYDYIG